MQGSHQRLDRWMWHARLARTRPLAAALAASGYVRLNGKRVKTPSRAVHPGDVLTIALPKAVKVLRIVDFSEHRGNPTVAQRLYEEIETVRILPAPPDLLAKRKSLR